MFLTFESAHEALVHAVEEEGGAATAELARPVAAYTRGLLLAARGNSGVIMAQLIGALLREVVSPPSLQQPSRVLAAAMAAATEAGYAAVGEPVEGTILSVSRAASDAAVAKAADDGAGVEDVLRAVVRAAREALDRTPEQLRVLRDAGVVDAGGAGLCLVLEAAEAAYTGRRLPHHDPLRQRKPLPVPMPTDDLTAEGPAYEVMYLLDAEDDALPGLRKTLAGLGDSLVVVGGEGLWNVHVHVDDVGAAVEAGVAAGRPHRIRVTHFVEQVAAARAAANTPDEATGRAVVVLAFGDGLAALFREAGGHVVEVTTSTRPSTGELLEAVRATG